ncbi:DUF559 domain-containing protein [Kribbia dieselivorans]|uniref:DUF559 domain-containing protein n=1 Tax=Kribbia dieselivorans TaxID=331526 RepID=UPI0008398FB4|nr:DUF559 domain-containing protein [Kribbia dieselivorans]
MKGSASGEVDVAALVAQLGGTAAYSDLSGVTQRQVRKAVENGTLCRVGRGAYALPGLTTAELAAAGLTGTVSGLSAALSYGWPVLHEPRLPEVTVPRGRNLPAGTARAVRVHYSALGNDRDGNRTSPLRTVIDCARWHPFEEALAVADSALRSGLLSIGEFRGAHLRGAGAGRVRMVLEAADGLAANPFESGLRAMALNAHPGFLAQPEARLGSGRVLHPDVGLPQQRLALEADSFEFHGNRKQLVADCWRYNELVVAGWTVLRFSWEHVMKHQKWVVATISSAVTRIDQVPQL